MNKVSKAVAGGAMVAALALPVGWAIMPASAQPDPTPTTAAASTNPTSPGAADPAGATPPDPTGDARAERRAARRAERQQRLADELGITTDELKAARLRVLRHELDDRVSAGKMTQERADQILDAAASGNLRALRRQLRAERAAR